MKVTKIPPYITIEKKVGETPLFAMEAWRKEKGLLYKDIPLAYAGRLDPLASGTLLVLIGETCKNQEKYHALDKTYEFSILFGVGSDTGDVMGRLTPPPYQSKDVTKKDINKVLTFFHGQISLPFPVFSAKTVNGKPLHTWAMENRLHEITIPTQTSHVHSIVCTKVETKMRATIYKEALEKINSIPKVTELRKALGNDFRRDDIRVDWKKFLDSGNAADRFTIAHIKCTASSGTYMRSLAEAVGKDLNCPSLAYHIHRTTIGRFLPLPVIKGIWIKKF